MSSAAEVRTEMATAAPQPIFASFQLGEEEFAVPAVQVQEVVNYPAHVVPMPLAPDFVRGIFDLRGAVIPMVDMDTLLGRPRRVSTEGTKVVIATCGGARLGLIFDDTRRVLRPPSADVQSFEYPEGSPHGVVSSVIKHAEGLVRVLDMKCVLSIEDVPQQRSGNDELRTARAKVTRRRCVTFCCGASRMAFPIAEIREILPASDIQESPVPEPLCAGIMQLRGRVLPVVGFSELVGAACAGDAGVAADRRVIVVAFEGVQVGLLVDAVESIDIYAQEDVTGIPMLNPHRASMFSGCIELGDRSHVFLLDPQAVLSRAEIGRITGNHSALFRAKEATEPERRRRNVTHQPYLWFVATLNFALPMRQVLEIVDRSDALIPMPGAPRHVVGMFDLRGRLATVVDVRRLYQLDDGAGVTSQDSKVVIIERGNQLLGLLVDSVCSILHVDPSQRMPVPQLMRKSLAPFVRSAIVDIISSEQADGKSAHVLALEAQSVIDTLAEHELATSNG